MVFQIVNFERKEKGLRPSNRVYGDNEQPGWWPTGVVSNVAHYHEK